MRYYIDLKKIILLQILISGVPFDYKGFLYDINRPPKFIGGTS